MSENSPNRSVELDELFEVLSDSCRRQTLVALRDLPGDAVEFDVADLCPMGGKREELALELYHTHLPKLAEVGVIGWDREDGTVRRGPCFEEVASVVDILRANEDDLPGEWP